MVIRHYRHIRHYRPELVAIIIFAIIALQVLLFFLIQPQMRFVIQFDSVPATNNPFFPFSINVHYRGFKVGRVTKIKLSQDQKHILFYVNIYYKGLIIPTNSLMIYKNENIYGKRYIDINYPEVPTAQYIQNGDTIDGVAAAERIDQYLVNEIKKGETGKLLQNLYDISEILKKTLSNKTNCKLVTQSAGDLSTILENLKGVTQDVSFASDLRSTIKCSSCSLKQVSTMLSDRQINQCLRTAPKTIITTCNNLDRVSDNVKIMTKILPSVNSNLISTNETLNDVNSNLGKINTKVPIVPQSLVSDAQQLVVKTTCIESELSNILSKRFLLLKLTFANPFSTLQRYAQNCFFRPSNQCSTK